MVSVQTWWWTLKWQLNLSVSSGSAQFSCSVMFYSLQPHGLQHPRPPCPSPTPRVDSNSSAQSVMPSNHLILCCPLLLPPSVFPNIRVFTTDPKSVLCIRWPEYWSFSFSFSISPSNAYSDWFPLGWTGLVSLQFKGLSKVFSNTSVQKHQYGNRELYFPGCHT